jgi:thiol:disulfide interchange protein DsbD
MLAATLLLLPATGLPPQGTAEGSVRPGAGRLPGYAAAAALAGLAAAAVWDRVAPPAEPLPVAAALPASSLARSVKWSDFGTALERAGAEGKPILVTFVTSWCPYCTKMRDVWRDGRVVERLADVLTVRVDAEDTRTIKGHSGAALAQRYEISGFPVQVLLDASGRPLGRADGYQSADQLLGWLDSTLGASARSMPGPGVGGVPLPRNR